jgi:inosose dehydratase
MKALSIEAALRACADDGYDCVELPVMPDWPADSARLDRAARRAIHKQLDERGVRLSALMENLPALGDDAQHRAHLQRLKRAAELARDLTPENGKAGKMPAPLIETIVGGKPGEFESVKERLAERLRGYAKVVGELEVVLAIKAHVGNATQQPGQLGWLLEQVASPWLKAAYDYSHFELQGQSMKETMDQLLPQSVFIHVKDTEHARGGRRFLLPGEGATDYAEYFRLLAASPYRGDVVVEVSGQVFSQAGYDPLAAARQCYNHLAAAMQASGLNRE